MLNYKIKIMADSSTVSKASSINATATDISYLVVTVKKVAPPPLIYRKVDI